MHRLQYVQYNLLWADPLLQEQSPLEDPFWNSKFHNFFAFDRLLHDHIPIGDHLISHKVGGRPKEVLLYIQYFN